MKNPTVILTEPGKVTVEDAEMPEVRDDDVLVQTERSLISTGTELTILSADYDPDSPWTWASSFPRPVGYSNVGTVVDRGRKTSSEWLGKRVATRGRHAAFVHSPVPVPGEPFVPPGVLMTAEVPREVDPGDASYFAVALIALNAVRRASVELGSAVAVYGMGLIGQLAARFSQLSGAGRVFCIDTDGRRLRFVPSAAEYVRVDAREEQPVERIAAENRGRLADIVIEATGSSSAIADEPRALRKFGRLVIVSSPRAATSFDFNALCLDRSITVIGCHENSHPLVEHDGSQWTRLRNAELFFELVGRKVLDVASLTTHTAAYTEAPAVYSRLLEDRGDSMGVILTWD